MTEELFRRITFHALADTETSQATYDLAMSLIEREIPGDFVECGVFAGSQAAMMARAIYEADLAGMPRKVHLFDTFCGIPLAGEHDQELQGKPAGISSCSLAQVKANMKSWGIPDDLLVYHEGLFEDTVPGCDIEQIAFLRLDGDLYSGTKVCMEHLYPKLTRGAWFCVDDFNLSGARKAVLDYVIPAPVYWRIPTK